MSKKKNLPENILKLKNQLETGNNLIDYFLVCGCDPSIIFNPNFLFNLSADKNENINNLSTILNPKIITKFPEFDNNNDTIDETILSYCFPHGFKPYYNDSGNNINEKRFSIILDNNLFSSEYPQKYLTCLIFYENLEKYKKFSEEILVADFIYENNEDIDLNIINNNEISIEDLKTRANTLHINEKQKHQRTYTKLIDQEPKVLNKISNIHNYKYYFIPKCICIVSIHPYVKLFQEILSSIYKYSQSNEIQKPLEKIIANFIIEVPIAPRGLYNIEFTLDESTNLTKILSRTESNKLLLTEIDLRKFHKNIKLNNQINVIKHLLLGSKILFFSKNINNLTESILSFLFLIFPFKYPFQVTSYLNKNNYNILESISPYFIGINESYNSDFFKKNDISIEGMDIFILDLDTNSTNILLSEELPKFPSKSLNNLKSAILKIAEENGEGEGKEGEDENTFNIEEEEKDDIFIFNNSNNNEYKIMNFNKIYQEAFFDFMCELIKNYEENLNMNYFKNTKDVLTSIETLFNCNSFIKSHSYADIPFYTKFVKDSQLFVDFIYKRMIPKNNQEIIDILLVNNTLTKIKNKAKFFSKNPTIDFTNSLEYTKNNKYSVPPPRDITESEKNYIIKNKDNLIKKGQIINISKKSNEPIKFKYTIFPQLDFDIYCNNDNANEYCPPPDYSEEIEAINTELISKSSLGQNMNRSLEMINYLYLSWLEVWAFSFWYIDKKERPYRFNQMIDVLSKVIHHEMNILNLLFEALSKCSENEMILKLYRKLIDLNINPSAFIYKIISSVADKTQMRELKKLSSSIKPNENIVKFKLSNNKNNFKRTFLCVEDYLEINTKLKFFSEFLCISCGEKINLLNICKTFSEIKNDILWVPCKCGEYNLPKIKVQFGTELLRDNVYKTSSIDEIVLHSPFNLKINIKNAVMNNYGTLLQVTEFKSQFKPLFWNFIWYCKIHKLNYEIILPYLKDIENLRRIKYKNRAKEIFEISYEDQHYTENVTRINNYSKTILERYVNNNWQRKIHKDDLKIENSATLEYIEKNKTEKLKNKNKEEIKNNEKEEKEEVQLYQNIKEKIIVNKEDNMISEEEEKEEKEEEEEQEKEEKKIEVNKEKEIKNEENKKIQEEEKIEENKEVNEINEITTEEDNNKEKMKKYKKEINNKEKDIKNEIESQNNNINPQLKKEEEKKADLMQEKEKIEKKKNQIILEDEKKGEELIINNKKLIEKKEVDKIQKQPIIIKSDKPINLNEELKKVIESKKIEIKKEKIDIHLKKVNQNEPKKKQEKELNYNLKEIEENNDKISIDKNKEEMEGIYKNWEKAKRESKFDHNPNIRPNNSNINRDNDFLLKIKKKLKKVETKEVK